MNAEAGYLSPDTRHIFDRVQAMRAGRGWIGDALLAPEDEDDPHGLEWKSAKEGKHMQRRELLGVLGATAAGLIAMTGGETEAAAAALDQAHEDCLKSCTDCAKECNETFHHCTKMVAEGKKEHAKALSLASDCAEFCGLSVSMISKHSPMMVHSCLACAEVCKACAAECDKFADMPQMKACAKACRECEKSCREMVKAMG